MRGPNVERYGFKGNDNDDGFDGTTECQEWRYSGFDPISMSLSLARQAPLQVKDH